MAWHKKHYCFILKNLKKLGTCRPIPDCMSTQQIGHGRQLGKGPQEATNSQEVSPRFPAFTGPGRGTQHQPKPSTIKHSPKLVKYIGPGQSDWGNSMGISSWLLAVLKNWEILAKEAENARIGAFKEMRQKKRDISNTKKGKLFFHFLILTLIDRASKDLKAQPHLFLYSLNLLHY
jgi:hypothetical protein